MASQTDPGIEKTFERFSTLCSALSVGFGLLVLTGWMFHIQSVKTILRGQVAVKVNTAVGLVLIGVALWLVRKEDQKRPSACSRVSQVLALMVSMIGLLSLLECWYGWDVGIDQLLFHAGPEDAAGSVRIGLMSPITAMAFLLLGPAVVLLNVRSRVGRGLMQMLTAVAAAAATFGILDFVLDPNQTHTHISPVTALVLFLFSFGVMFSRTSWGLGFLLASTTSGGVLGRRLLPAAVIIPMVIGWLRWKGEFAGLYSDWTGVALMIVVTVALLACIIIWTAWRVDYADAQRQAAGASVQRLAWIVTSSNDAIVGETFDGIVTSWSPGAEATYGYSAQEMIGHPLTIAIPPDRLDEFHAIMQKVAQGESLRQFETLRIRKDREIIDVSLSVSPLKDETGKIVGASSIVRDITERKRMEERLKRMNRTLRALSECTETLMRATDEAGMLQKVCNVVVGVAGYRMAWVGYAEHDANKTVRPMAAAGFEEGYLRTTNISWADVEQGRGPTGTCIRSGKTAVCQDTVTDPRFLPWRKESVRRGYRSSIAIPLKIGEDVLGALMIYAVDAGAFDPDAQGLLEELASNMTYAITALRARVESKEAEVARRESETAFEVLANFVPQLVWICLPDGMNIYFNRRWVDYTGLALEESYGRGWNTPFHPDDKQAAWDAWNHAVTTGEMYRVESRLRAADGTYRWFLMRGVPLRDGAGNIVKWFGTCTDIDDMKRAEAELREASSYARSLLEASLDPLVTISEHGKITDVNRATEEATGIPRDRLIGSDFSNYFTEPEKARSGYEEVFAKGFVHDYPLAIRHTSGNVTDVLYNASIFKNERGEIGGVFAAARDITARKRAEAALQAERQRFSDVLDVLPAYVVLLSPDYHVPFANKFFEERFGKSHGKRCYEYLFGRSEPCEICETYKALSTKAPQRWKWTGPDGRHYDIYDFPFTDTDGSNLILEMGIDITEREKAEQEVRKLNCELEERVQQRTAQLQESEQRVRRKLDSILSPEGDLRNLELADLLDIGSVQSMAEDLYALAKIPMFLVDLKGNPLVAVGWQEICTKFHRVHPDACRNCTESDLELSKGVTPGAFKLYKCKNNMWDVVTPIMMGEEHVGDLFSGQFFFTDEPLDYALFRSQAQQYGFDEKEYIAALDRAPRLSRDAVNTGMAFFIKFAQLLSQLSYSSVKLARSAEETRRINEDLAASVRELEAFTYSVSHDLRAPLRHISGFSKILTEEFGASLPEEAQHHVRRIEEGTRRMGQLVDDLLNLARVGRRDLNSQVTGLRSVVDEVIAELKADTDSRTIEWKIGALPYVECDPGLMKQVFQNLISNALKFTRPRSPAIIEIGREEKDGAPVLFVRDNGVGFSMKYADKLFGVFQRLHRTEDFEGTGVGLATVQRIIQKHGGRIWAEAELDKGATFYFTLGNSEQTQPNANALVAGGKA